MATYILRNLPPETWDAFRARAAREDCPLRALFLAFIQGYADGRFALLKPQVTVTVDPASPPPKQ